MWPVVGQGWGEGMGQVCTTEERRHLGLKQHPPFRWDLAGPNPLTSHLHQHCEAGEGGTQAVGVTGDTVSVWPLPL